MRKAINENPMVQIAVIGVLVLVVGLFMMMNMKKKSGGSESSSSASSSGLSSPSTGGSAPIAGSTGGTSPSTGSVGTAAPPPPTTGTITPEALIPGPGLPKNVVDAWRSGDAVVLLIVRGGGIDDRLVRGSVRSLNGDPGTAVFVTRAKDIARYSRITQGVGVDRVPALVVVRPRRESSVPEAQVSYGFRDSQSVVQAVHDALYDGRDDLPYSPR
jgi:hypothetical protein